MLIVKVEGETVLRKVEIELDGDGGRYFVRLLPAGAERQCAQAQTSVNQCGNEQWRTEGRASCALSIG